MTCLLDENQKAVEVCQNNTDSMWSAMEMLFPFHRTLVGPGFSHSLNMIKEQLLELTIHKFPSKTKSFDWVIPFGFEVEEAYVEFEDGSRPIDFKNDSYHIWNYSDSCEEYMSLEELKKHISTLPDVPDAIPLRDTYYKKRWGLSASQKTVDSLKEGTYKVCIKTKHVQDNLLIGDFYLPGRSDKEILLSSYLCHPKGANDNLSGVVLGIELMKLLSKVKDRHYSYRFTIWPETIGSVTYIANFQEQIKKTIGSIHLTCIGDNGKFTYKRSNFPNELVDKAVEHVLKYEDVDAEVRDYYPIGGDERQFNTHNVGVPCGTLMRSPPNEFPYYHTNLDDLDYVRPEYLTQSLEVAWKILATIEKAKVYKPNYQTEPFLSGHGIFPYDLGFGSGERGGIYNKVVSSYYHLIPYVDGKRDLIDIANKSDISIEHFARAVSDFLKVGLIEEV